jgi:hypothetical protein
LYLKLVLKGPKALKLLLQPPHKRVPLAYFCAHLLLKCLAFVLDVLAPRILVLPMYAALSY